MSSNKNLLAAKSALGLDGSGSGGSSRGSTIRSSSTTTKSRASASAAATTNANTSTSFKSRSSTSATAAGRSTTATSTSRTSKHSFIHDLSASARQEARRSISSSYEDSDESLLSSRVSRISGSGSGTTTATTSLSSAALQRAHSLLQTTTTTPSSHRRRKYSITSAETLEEEGSELDSLTAAPPPPPPISSRLFGGGSHTTLASGSRTTTTTTTRASSASRISSLPTSRQFSGEDDSSTTLNNSSSSSGPLAMGTSGIITNRVVRRNTTTNSSGRNSRGGNVRRRGSSNSNNDSVGNSLGSSSTFGNFSAYEKKVDYKTTTALRGSKKKYNNNRSSSSSSNRSLSVGHGQQQQQSNHQQSLLSIQEDGTNSLLEMGGGSSSNSNSTNLLSLTESSSSQQQQTTNQQHQEEFIPQRFQEMRALLSAITPMQLEALMLEIFGNDNTTNSTTTSGSTNTLQQQQNQQLLPPGWNNTLQKSKTNKFRKDAYLSEMSLGELQRFALDKNFPKKKFGILPIIEECTSCGECLDVIAVEFERLVSCHQNGHGGGGDDSRRMSYISGTSSVSNISTNNNSTNTNNNNDMMTMQNDEGANLRRSLRVCSLPELRLVAERLQLDHASCVDKGELILMIECSMPDTTSVGGGGGGGSSSDGASSSTSVYSRQMQQQHQQGEERQEYDEYYSNQQQQWQEGSESDIDYNNNSNDHDHHHHHQQYNDFDNPTNQYYNDNDNTNDNNDEHDQSQSSYSREEEEENNRRVKFSTDCKQDTSHLIPKREKGGSWQSFVIAAEKEERGEGGVGRLLYRDGGNGGGDDEYGENDNGDGGGGAGGKKRRKRRKLKRPQIVNDSLASIQRIKESNKVLASISRIPFPALPCTGNWMKVLGLLFVIGLIVGLSLFFTKDNGDGGEGGGPELLMPDLNDPFFVGIGNDNDGGGGLSGVSGGDNGDNNNMPSVQPSVSPSGKTNAGGGTVVGSFNTSSWSFPTQKPTVAASLDATDEEPIEKTSPSALSYDVATPSPVTPAPVEPILRTNSPTPNPTIIPDDDTPMPIITPAPTILSQWIDNDIKITTTPQPTPLSPYPLLGPFVETSMKLILYNISELNHMGRTQWRMLTAAYVEQFFNKGGREDTADAIQNIVFDVVANIEIEGEITLEKVGAAGAAAAAAAGGSGSVTGLIMTFTMTISYRTFSPNISVDTVAERPFFDERIRNEYVQFLIDSNALAHIGDLTVVSPIFHGTDIPEAPAGAIITQQPQPPPPPPPPPPTQSPLFTIPQPLQWIPMPDPTGSPTEEDNPVTQRPMTPMPSPEPTPSPVHLATAEPTPFPVKQATPEPTPSPAKQATPEPISPPPTVEQQETAEPTPTLTIEQETADPTPSPTIEQETPEPTPMPSMKPTPQPTPLPIQQRETSKPTITRDETYYPTPTELILPTLQQTQTPKPSIPRPETYYPTPTGLLSTYPTLAPYIPGSEEENSTNRNKKFTYSPVARIGVLYTFSPVASSPNLTPSTAANVIQEPSKEDEEKKPIAPMSRPTPSPRRQRSPPPTNEPTHEPTNEPTVSPTTELPTIYCQPPVNDPICPLLTKVECCRPMCTWDSTIGRCSFLDDETNISSHEVKWMGEIEIGQTHVIKAVNEQRHAPRIIAHREAELLFTPSSDIGGSSLRRTRRLGNSLHTKSTSAQRASGAQQQRIESVGTVYLIKENSNDGKPILDASAQRLLDGSNSVFSLSNDTPNINIIVDLNSLRLVEEVSVVLHGDTALEHAKLGLHYDDGRNQEEEGNFQVPEGDWMWLDIISSSNADLAKDNTISITIPQRQARYVMIRFEGGHSESSPYWGFGRIEISGSMDGLLPSLESFTPQRSSAEKQALPMTRAIYPASAAMTFTPTNTASVRVAVYSSAGKLIGTMFARDPSRQRGVLERRLSLLKIQDYSELIWSATLPFNWVDEGNVVLIGCFDETRQQLLVHRLELRNLAQFSEHTITRTKVAIFGSQSEVANLDSTTHEGKRLVRNLYSVMPVAELKWADTDLWHLPYIVVMGNKGPALVNSEEERRSVTGKGDEISWSVLKNFLTIRHSLAQIGHGFSTTTEDGANSPYASGTSVFMGWSLSKQNGDEWGWEDLGYWDTLAAAAWTGWCAMKAGDECSNYFVHEMGHAQTMQHFDEGSASNWGIAEEYPHDGKHMSHHPWGYDTVARQFRTWFDPFQGDGKLDPLNGAGEGPTYDQCFSQYTPYQAKKSQQWALSTPILLSASSSDVPADGAYKFNPSTREYSPLVGTLLADAVGEAAMKPDQVGIPVVTLIGTIGKSPDVSQTYPAFRSSSGNTFHFPDPFYLGLPAAFKGAAHYVEVRFYDGKYTRGLIAVEKDIRKTSLRFFSFNVAIERRPMSVALYRFTDSSYPNITPQSGTELLHLRPIELPPDDLLEGLPPLLKVGRGWLGDSSDVVLDRFCVTSEECNSDVFNIKWRGDVGSDSIVYTFSLRSEPQEMLGATVFKVPATREWDSTEYSITVLATRFFNDGLGSASLRTRNPPSYDGSSDIDATHGIRVVAPWVMNSSLPAGNYHSIPGSLKISAYEAIGDSSNNHLLDLNISLNLGTITEAPTRAPTKKPSPGPSRSPVQVRYYIDWNTFTCVTDGESTEWAPPHESKADCCHKHMAYDFVSCMRSEQ